MDTHGACVFLAGDDVYKVKRAVHYPYMDFSTLAKRKAACEAEIAVNRDNAPGIYIGTVPITWDLHGLHLGGSGEVREWAVHMRRFDENATLDHLADKGLITPNLIDSLARTVSVAHKRSPSRIDMRAAATLRHALEETLEELELRKTVFPELRVQALRAAIVGAYQKQETLIRKRVMAGKVRRCHGDLHLGNIALLREGPLLFDAIEFDETIATIDTLYDLAFLLMDLCEHGLGAQACRLLNRYLWLADDEAGEIEGLALLPLFLSLRAAIRAKVLVLQSDLTGGGEPQRVQARTYLEAALRFIAPSRRRLVAVGGLSGTGKSVVTTELAPHLGAAPGALHLRSDIERKKAAGVGETVRLGPDAYGPVASQEVYQRLRELARLGLDAGRCVIVDATFQEDAERSALESIAADTHVPFDGLWLEAPIEICRSRVLKRRDDASDATVDVVERQARQDKGVITWTKIDASADIESTAAAALRALPSPPNT